MTDAQTLKIRYRNYRGEVSDRVIVPRRVFFGATEWHPEPQWMLEAYDVAKDADRNFAMADFLPTDAQVLEHQKVKALVIALRPFDACIFNDNGDVTISTGDLLQRDWLRLRAALRDLDADQ